MRKSMILPVLLLGFLLTACGGEEAGSGRNSFWDELGVEETETVLVVDGREIPAWRYVWWLAGGCSAMEDACAAGGLALDWDTPLEEGTLGEYVQRQALEDTVLYATVEGWAETRNIMLTGEPAGDTIPQGALPLEDWQRQELEWVGLLYGELCALAARPDSPLLTEADLAGFADAGDYLTVDRIAFPAGAERETARRQAEEAFARLNNAGDKAAVFEALSAGDGSAEPVTIQVGDGTLDGVLESGAAALEPGQHSGILETEEGFWILRRLAPDRVALAPLWLEQELLHAAEAAEVMEREGFQKLTVSAVSAVISGVRQG